MRVSLRPLVPLLISTAPRGLHRSSTTLTMSSIEVERKFEPPTDLEALNDAVLKAGGTQLGSKSFTDIYYDTLPGCSLTRRDTWLRCRDGAWELKLPVEEDAKRSGGERTVFKEVEGAEPVNAALRELLPADAIASSLEETLKAAKLIPFAEFTTTRTKWKLGGCGLDADVASFGHAVMEIEVLVKEKSEVAEAEAEINRVADLVGATPLKSMGGKLETFIRRHSPEVFAALVEEGILQP